MKKHHTIVRIPYAGGWSKGQLLCGAELWMAAGDNQIGSKTVKPQYLYFLSNEEIKEGDWMICPDGMSVLKWVGYGRDIKLPFSFINGNDYKKIVASTDQSLKLPAIPHDWIANVYVPSQGIIKEVWLETEVGLDDLPGYPDEIEVLRIKNNEVIVVETEIHEHIGDNNTSSGTSSTGRQVDKCDNYKVHLDVVNLCKECKDKGLTQCQQYNNPDQELEDAAKKCAARGGPFSTHRQNYEYMFKEGARWKGQQLQSPNEVQA